MGGSQSAAAAKIGCCSRPQLATAVAHERSAPTDVALTAELKALHDKSVANSKALLEQYEATGHAFEIATEAHAREGLPIGLAPGPSMLPAYERGSGGNGVYKAVQRRTLAGGRYAVGLSAFHRPYVVYSLKDYPYIGSYPHITLWSGVPRLDRTALDDIYAKLSAGVPMTKWSDARLPMTAARIERLSVRVDVGETKVPITLDVSLSLHA